MEKLEKSEKIIFALCFQLVILWKTQIRSALAERRTVRLRPLVRRGGFLLGVRHDGVEARVAAQRFQIVVLLHTVDGKGIKAARLSRR